MIVIAEAFENISMSKNTDIMTIILVEIMDKGLDNSSLEALISLSFAIVKLHIEIFSKVGFILQS